MVSLQNIETLKSDIKENIKTILWKERAKASKVFEIPFEEVDILLFLFYYFIKSFNLAGKKAPSLFNLLYIKLPRINEINHIHEFLNSFKNLESFWQIYLPGYKVKYKSFIHDITEYLLLDLNNYDGNTDLEKFYNWIEKVSTTEPMRYGSSFSVIGIQELRKVMGLNVIVPNMNIDNYLKAIFGKDFNKHSAAFIFELVAKQTDWDLWHINVEIDKLFLKLERERRTERKSSKQSLVARQHQMLKKAKERISIEEWKEIHLQEFQSRDLRIKKILKRAGLDYQEYWEL